MCTNFEILNNTPSVVYCYIFNSELNFKITSNRNCNLFIWVILTLSVIFKEGGVLLPSSVIDIILQVIHSY